MKRRSLLLAALLPFLPFSALAHTPYRQWEIFRKSYLQILTSHADYDGDKVGDEWVAVVLEKSPLSRAMVSRARDLPRVASLLKTNQSKFAVLSYLHARLMFTGAAPFEDYSPMPLEVLIDNGKYLLVCRSDVPLHHGYFVTAALMEEAKKLRLLNPTQGKFGMPVHAGAKAFFNGDKLEPPTAES